MYTEYTLFFLSRTIDYKALGYVCVYILDPLFSYLSQSNTCLAWSKIHRPRSKCPPEHLREPSWWLMCIKKSQPLVCFVCCNIIKRIIPFHCMTTIISASSQLYPKIIPLHPNSFANIRIVPFYPVKCHHIRFNRIIRLIFWIRFLIKGIVILKIRIPFIQIQIPFFDIRIWLSETNISSEKSVFLFVFL